MYLDMYQETTSMNPGHPSILILSCVAIHYHWMTVMKKTAPSFTTCQNASVSRIQQQTLTPRDVSEYEST